jgi:hypothetical protein
VAGRLAAASEELALAFLPALAAEGAAAIGTPATRDLSTSSGNGASAAAQVGSSIASRPKPVSLRGIRTGGGGGRAKQHEGGGFGRPRKQGSNN